jgi:effector-binding domain-containing protein
MKRKRRWPWAIVATVGVLAVVTIVFPLGCSVFGIRTTEEAGYEVIRQDGSFELREYDELVIVETTVEKDFEEAGNIAFRRLFKYISGENAAKTEIAMTAPVVADPAQPPEGEKIAMTAPVLSEEQEGGWRYVFVLPASFSIDTAPAPTNPDVRLVSVPAKKVAALRYSGSWNEDAMRDNSRELQQWIEANGLKPVSAPRAAGYDPPWTIPFLRRNEILIDVE